MVESLELSSWYTANIAQHDQCMTSSLFHPVALSQTCSNFNTKTRILWFYSIQMLFSSFLTKSHLLSIVSYKPFTFSISYGSRVFPKAWTHRAQSFGSHQSAAEMGDRNPSDWLHVQPARRSFGVRFFLTKKKVSKAKFTSFSHHNLQKSSKITHIFWLLQHLISSPPLTPRSSCIAA